MRWYIVALAAVALMVVAPVRADEPVRPNILFCIADDWGWPHAGVYGDPVVKTPAFDRLARDGVVFEHAYVSSPSCTPSRNAILTGQYHWRLERGANLWSTLDTKHPVYPLLLEKAGYHVGHWRKSWGPGRLEPGGYTDAHPAGRGYNRGFKAFLEARPDGAPFCFWLGASDPHRPYKAGSGAASGIDLARVPVPKFWPDVEPVRSDIADYYFEVQRFDADVAAALKLLEERGELENTIVVMTGDHGMPFPRCKSNLYDMGVRVPLAIRWGKNVRFGADTHGPAGRRIDAFVSLVDLAPTFLHAAGLETPDVMTGRSLLPLVLPNIPGHPAQSRDRVVFGKERHVPSQAHPSTAGYPCRGIRTDRWLYIRNYAPDRWPAGIDDPDAAWSGWRYSDCDGGPTKDYILTRRADPGGERFYQLNFGKRPAEELYDTANDPDQLTNLAADPAHADTLQRLSSQLTADLQRTADPRETGGPVEFDEYPYFGGSRRKK